MPTGIINKQLLWLMYRVESQSPNSGYPLSVGSLSMYYNKGEKGDNLPQTSPRHYARLVG